MIAKRHSRSEKDRRYAVQLDGILNINKPSGITSMDVIRRVKRASGQKRVGHGGTLDPLASGVIPVCIGRATRLMEYLFSSTKVYLAQMELGVETDTYDESGTVLSRHGASSISLTAFENVLTEFKGRIFQVPPMYSALKKGGKRLYELARKGVVVERKPREIEVFDLDLIDWSPPIATLYIRCSRGFYVRSLAHDIGQTLGCGAILKNLVRQKTGPFSLEDSVSLEEFERKSKDGDWADLLSHPDIAIRHMRAVIVDSEVEDMVGNGRPLPPVLQIPSRRSSEECRVYTKDGVFIAILAFDSRQKQWKPTRVFSG